MSESAVVRARMRANTVDGPEDGGDLTALTLP